MNKMLTMSLLGSSSSLGTNWIYDRKLMIEFSKNKDMLFLPIQHELYLQAEHGFDVYPNHKIGDLDFMGEVGYIFHNYLNSSKTENLKQYFYNNFGPKSSYNSYIEKYGQVLIDQISNGEVNTTQSDTQLIGPTMYVVGHANGLNKTEIINYSKVLTSYIGTGKIFNSLEYLFNNLKSDNKRLILNKSINYLPETYQKSCKAALSAKNIYNFIDEHSGIACDFEQSYPLILYIVINTDNYKNALSLNASLGGASSARGIIIGAIFSLLDDIPKEYESLLNHSF